MGLKLLKNVGVLMVLLMELSRLAPDVMTSHERLASIHTMIQVCRDQREWIIKHVGG